MRSTLSAFIFMSRYFLKQQDNTFFLSFLRLNTFDLYGLITSFFVSLISFCITVPQLYMDKNGDNIFIQNLMEIYVSISKNSTCVHIYIYLIKNNILKIKMIKNIKLN